MTAPARRSDPEAERLALADLARSGLDQEVLEPGTGISVLSAAEALKADPTAPWWRWAPEGLPCLLLEYRDAAGKRTGGQRLRRLADPPAGSFGAQVELPRYAQPKGTVPPVWFSRAVDWAKIRADTSIPLAAVEGEKKAEALCRAGFPAVGLGGVFNFAAAKKGITVLPELLAIQWSGRRVVILFDTDPKPKTRMSVALAASRLGDLLRSQGAEVFKAELPALPGHEKVGADDFLVAEGPDALREILQASAPAYPPEELTDLGNATRLARRAEGLFLYVPAWRRWIAWDALRWNQDRTIGTRIRELAVEVAKDLLLEARREPDPDRQKKLVAHAFRSQAKDRIDAMVNLAPDAWPALKVAPEQLDQAAWLLNTESGTIDLKTGELRPHDPDDLLTVVAPVEYRPDARSKLWDKTLREILPDEATRRFLQRWFGYCLTGSVREEKLVFFSGRGRNGKGVIMETLMAALGHYAHKGPEELLLTSKSDRHPTELVTLFGKRAVFASEVGTGKTWNVARVKGLTGGDPISARGMREDFWTFLPTHKVMLLGNERPRCPAEDDAFWARMRVVPFEVEFRDPDDPDPERQRLPVRNEKLKEQLRGELPGVLAWAVRGCLEWQRAGSLGEPAEVRIATAEYRDESKDFDPVGQWLRRSDALFAKVGADGKTVGAKGVPLQELTDRYNDGPRPKLSSRELGIRVRALGYTVRKAAKGVRTVFPPASAGSERREPGQPAEVVPLRGRG